jgi:uncharacterized protein
MDKPWKNVLSHVIWPIASLAIVVVAKQARGMSWRDLGLSWPSLRAGLLWLVFFVALAAAEELVGKAWGVAAPGTWGAKYSAPAVAIRVLAMVVLAPVSEEMLFRGLLYKVLSETPVGPVGAILITAAGFALIHFQYYGPEMLFVALDALFYGVARYATGSTVLTMILHGLGNLYAAYQRVGR